MTQTETQLLAGAISALKRHAQKLDIQSPCRKPTEKSSCRAISLYVTLFPTRYIHILLFLNIAMFIQLINHQVARNCITSDISDSVKLNNNQYGALCSWAFNVGCGAAGSSTLIRDLNAGQDPDTVASQQLPLWNQGSNGVLPGLTRRRAAEVALFKTASSTIAHPPPC
jgi:hypothetical protein